MMIVIASIKHSKENRQVLQTFTVNGALLKVLDPHVIVEEEVHNKNLTECIVPRPSICAACLLFTVIEVETKTVVDATLT